jgi:hypothetical protein
LSLLERTFSFPNNDLSHLFRVIRLGLNKCCEDRLDDLGAAGSEIVTLSNQLIHFSYDLLVNSNTEFLFHHL